MICEKCEQEHDGTYGSGRFCSSKCARGFSTKNDERYQKEAHCFECQQKIFVDKRADVNRVKCHDCKNKKNAISDEEIIEACEKHLSMGLACEFLKMPFSSFKRRAIKLGVYVPNQGGKGYKIPSNRISLDEILEGKHPNIKGTYVKSKLFVAGLKEEKCEECDIADWNGKSIVLEIDHIDGNNKNHRFDNLKILCPNCHSQTPTFRRRNK